MIKQIAFNDGCSRIAPLLSERVKVSVDELKSGLEGGVFYDCSGAIVYVRGPEIHACAPVETRGRWMSKAVIRDVLKPIIDKYGFARTTATTELGKKFVIGLGFIQDGDYWILRGSDGD